MQAYAPSYKERFFVVVLSMHIYTLVAAEGGYTETAHLYNSLQNSEINEGTDL